MGSIDRGKIAAVFDALDVAVDAILDVSFEALTTPERLALLARCERVRRRLPAIEHPLINQLAEQADPSELGGKLAWAIADRLRITRGEARRRIGDADELGERRAITGEPLPPLLAPTAAAQALGKINTAHVRVIRDFLHQLPDAVDLPTRDSAEAHLAELAGSHRPDELARLAERLNDCLNPDGDFSDTDRARRRTLLLGRQDKTGMTPITGWLDPQTRAALDVVLAKWASPGMCNPADEQPCTDGTPSQPAIDGDTRSAGQRNHDALTALTRAMLASGQLGQHNGLPATVIVSTSLTELERATGKARTSSDSCLPIRDLIKLAGHAHHYLRIFDGAKELALLHTKRLASPGQRIVLHARDRGCTHPNCPIPGIHCEAHHNTDYAYTGVTDVDDLSWRCGPHHDLITTGGWKTRRRKSGETETVPPAHLDHGQPRTNRYHHPEKLLQDHNRDGTAEDDDGDNVATDGKDAA